MNEHFVVPSTAAGDLIAFDIDGDDVLIRHFFETDARRLHEEETGIVGVTQRNVAGDVIALAFMSEHTARIG